MEIRPVLYLSICYSDIFNFFGLILCATLSLVFDIRNSILGLLVTFQPEQIWMANLYIAVADQNASLASKGLIFPKIEKGFVFVL